MGYREMDLVWDNSQASKTDKLVLLAIARRYKVGVGAWPSQDYLAKVCGVDNRSIRNSIRRLEALGELRWVKGSNLSQKANLYWISCIETTKTSGDLMTKTSAISAKTSGENDKNFRLLYKQLNKLDKQEINKFESKDFTQLFWKSCDVSGFAPLQVQVLLKQFEQSFECSSAYTEKVRLERWWTFLNNAERDAE